MKKIIVKTLLYGAFVLAMYNCSNKNIENKCKDLDFTINDSTIPSVSCDYEGTPLISEKEKYGAIRHNRDVVINLIGEKFILGELQIKLNDIEQSSNIFQNLDEGLNKVSLCFNEICLDKYILIKNSDSEENKILELINSGRLDTSFNISNSSQLSTPKSKSSFLLNPEIPEPRLSKIDKPKIPNNTAIDKAEIKKDTAFEKPIASKVVEHEIPLEKSSLAIRLTENCLDDSNDKTQIVSLKLYPKKNILLSSIKVLSRDKSPCIISIKPANRNEKYQIGQQITFQDKGCELKLLGLEKLIANKTYTLTISADKNVIQNLENCDQGRISNDFLTIEGDIDFLFDLNFRYEN